MLDSAPLSNITASHPPVLQTELLSSPEFYPDCTYARRPYRSTCNPDVPSDEGGIPLVTFNCWAFCSVWFYGVYMPPPRSLL